MAQDSFREELLNYLGNEVASKEHNSICLVGCGEAGSKLVGIFRLKPDFIAAPAPTLFPVRAVVMDTQPDLRNRMGSWPFRWSAEKVQIPFTTPPAEEYERLLLDDLEDLENSQADRETRYVRREGGAGGFALDGRVHARHNLIQDTQRAEEISGSLGDSGVFSRESTAFLVTFSGLGGGTGSGSVPVVVEWMQDTMAKSQSRGGSAPVATLSVCIVPEQQHYSDNPDPRTQYNLLASLYYLADTRAINGVILADNDMLDKQGHHDLVYDMNTYLQDVLMPLFLAPLDAHHYDTQIDPADMRRTLAPKGDKRHEFIAAGFSVFPMQGSSKRIRDMKSHTVTADRGQVPDIRDMLNKALESTTIDCDTRSARSVLALLSGPEEVLRQIVPDNPSRFRFEEYLKSSCMSQAATDSSGSARFSIAKFPRMTDVRLTVLLSGCRFPQIEESIGRALDNDPRWTLGEGDSLADALRRLPESLVVGKGRRFMSSGE